MVKRKMVKRKEKKAGKTLQRFVKKMREDEILERIRSFDTVEDAIEFWKEVKEAYIEEIELLKKYIQEEKKGVYIKEVYPEEVIYIIMISKLEEAEIEDLLTFSTWKLIQEALKKVEPQYRKTANELMEITNFDYLCQKRESQFIEILRFI